MRYNSEVVLKRIRARRQADGLGSVRELNEWALSNKFDDFTTSNRYARLKCGS
jgi:hypothetical protein